MRQYIGLLILLSLISAKQVYSQVKFKSELPLVQTSGFYNVELSPEQVSVSTRNDLLDIRVFQDGKEQPFITNVSSNKIIRSLNNIALIQNSFKDSANTVIINKESLSQIYIAINKSDIIKYVQVRGSHDKNTWFIIKKNTRLETVEFNDSEDIYLIELPKNEYKYYEFTLTNNIKGAMEVLWAGTETKELIESEFSPVNLGNFTIKDSAKKSFIQFNNLNIAYKIDKIKLNIDSDFGYRRDVNMGRWHYFEINSNDLAPKNISATISENTVIEITNGDNSPLKIKSIDAFQQKRYLTVYLKEGLKYILESGKPNTPDYDLKYLQNEIPKERVTITTNNIEYIYPEIEKPRELKWFEKPIFLWGTIGIVGAFLLLLCFKMVRQLEEKKD